MTTVYAVEHSGIEDDRYVRGVYATRELAETASTMDEVTWYGDRVSRQSHDWYCCGAVEYPVAESLPELWHGPDEPVVYDASNSLIPDSVIDALIERFRHPYRDLVMAGVSVIEQPDDTQDPEEDA